jgi:hypothetical protein
MFIILCEFLRVVDVRQAASKKFLPYVYHNMIKPGFDLLIPNHGLNLDLSPPCYKTRSKVSLGLKLMV